MRDKKAREKKRLLRPFGARNDGGKGRIALLIALPLVAGLFLSFAISPLGSYDQQTTEVVIHKSPLIWRADGAGDYLLSELAADGTYKLIEAVETGSQIETLTAIWEFKGEVTLELSANNGQDYTPVVYGVPLTSGFTSGNQLKWRVTLGPDSELSEVRIAYTDTSGAGGTFSSPELSGFQFREPLYITNPSGEGLFNYQVKIEVEELENIQADFADVRFTATDGETLLAHYLEKIEGAAPNRVATFYVKVPQIPARPAYEEAGGPAEGLSLYLYYGNPEAEDISSAEETFDFFDGFTEDALDLEKWQKTGTATISAGQLKLEGAEIVSKTYQIKDGIIEYRARADAGNEIRLILRSEKEEALPEAANQIAYSSSYEGAEHCIAVGDIVKANQAQAIVSGETYDYRVILQGTNLTFQRYSQNYEQLQAEVTYDDTGGLTSGNIGLKAGAGCTSYFDRVRVRKFAQPEPRIASSGKEEPTNLARFSGTTLAKNGNLILAEGNTNGIYISKVIPIPFPARIMIPSFVIVGSDPSPSLRGSEAAEAISLDISADAGKTYKTDCKSGSYYYASRGDFAAGSNLRYRLRFTRTNKQSSNIQDLGLQVEEVSIDYRPGSIFLVSPNGREAWPAGTRQKILWLASGYEPTYPMRIEYSLDNGKTYNTIIEERENIGLYSWSVPPKLSGKKVLIRVSDALDENIYDTSDGMVEIR